MDCYLYSHIDLKTLQKNYNNIDYCNSRSKILHFHSTIVYLFDRYHCRIFCIVRGTFLGPLFSTFHSRNNICFRTNHSNSLDIQTILCRSWYLCYKSQCMFHVTLYLLVYLFWRIIINFIERSNTTIK